MVIVVMGFFPVVDYFSDGLRAARGGAQQISRV
jgi:hypothetical protein